MITCLRNYLILMRMNSLFGAFLLLIPSLWSIAYNMNNFDKDIVIIYLLFIIGSILLRSFGCIVNDLIDINVDMQVMRTKERPLASGKVSKKEAYILLFIILIISLFILLQFNLFAQILAVSSLILVYLYPFTKRFFYAPQIILGIVFNWGILLADAVLNERISLGSIIMYIGSIFWTIGYDVVYAYQDYEDDKKIGVKSLTILIGDTPAKIVACFYMIMLIFLIITGILENTSIYFYILIILPILFLIRMSLKLNYFDNKECFQFFKNNIYVGFIIWIGYLIK